MGEGSVIIRQRIFAAFPEPPATITLGEIFDQFGDVADVYGAVRGLCKSGHVEPYGRATYRKIEGATMPEDRRGGPRPGAASPRAA